LSASSVLNSKAPEQRQLRSPTDSVPLPLAAIP
jgi:hypothetical protein